MGNSYILTGDQYKNSIKAAIDFINKNGIYLVYPSETLDGLKNIWNKFMSQPKQVRKKADMISYDFFGFDNYDHYKILKNRFYSQDKYYNSNESTISLDDKENDIYNYISNEYKNMQESVITESFLSEQSAVIKEVLKEAKDNNITIVYPCNNLESLNNLIDEYYSMIDSDKELSDSICKKYFKLTNEELYYKLKHNEYPVAESAAEDKIKTNALSFAKKYMKKIITYESPKVIMETSFKLYNLFDNNLDRKLFEDSITKDIADMDIVNNNIVNIDTIYTDYPYFTADKMIDLGVFSGTTNCFDNIADNTMLEDNTPVEDWFDAYKNNNINYLKEHNLARVHTLEKLYSDLEEVKESGDNGIINSRYQSILELGWDPNVDFSPENRSINDKKIKDFLDRKTKFIDLRGITDDDISGYVENSKGEKLYPIFIILISRDRLISKIIKFFTKSNLSHAAISFDPELKDVWSFNGVIDLKAEDPFGGLIREPIDIFEDHYVEVYCTFVKKKYYDNLRYTIEYFKNNKNDFGFDHVSFLKYLFGINVNQTNKFVCSSFTDRMLQVANVNLRNNNEYKKLVSPQKLRTDLSINNKIFMLYSGKANEYNYKSIDKLINKISKDAEYFSENGLMENNSFTIEEIDTDFCINEDNIDLDDYYDNNDVIKYNDNNIKEYLDKKTKIIDLRRVKEDEIPGYYLSKKGEKLYPVYICLASGVETFSKIVKFLTRSNVSHATIGFSPELDKIYSFNDEEKVLYSKKSKSGLSEESVDFFRSRGLNIEVYVTFVKEKYYENLKYTINYMKKNSSKYRYDYIGLLKYLFNLNVDETNKFVCSSFTDRMLQVANINLRNNNEYKKLISPAKLQKEAKNNNKVFCLYSGSAMKYNPKKIEKLVKKISKTATYFSEAFNLKLTFKKKRKFPIFFLYYYDNIYLSITPSLDELYYFNKNVNGSQLLKTSSEDFSKEAIVGLYICFVSEDRYRKILQFIEEASAPFYKYTYSQINILYKLMNINFGTNTPDKMCIEMIDKTIRLSDCVDAKKMDDIQKSAYKNLDDLIKRKLDIYGKIYKVYFDRLKNYNMTNIEMFISNNIDNAKVIKESFSEGSFYRSVILDTNPDEKRVSYQPTAFKQFIE